MENGTLENKKEENQETEVEEIVREKPSSEQIPQGFSFTGISIPKNSPITILFCAICTLIFLGLSQEPGELSNEVAAKYGYYGPAAIWDGKYWALISSVFVHYQFLHYFFNVYWLWNLGSALERKIGSVKFILFFIVASIISSGLELAAAGSTGVGASGVVYAIFGFMWIAKQRYREFEVLLPKQTVVTIIAWLFICIAIDLSGVLNIGNTAHFSGMLFGAGIAAALVLKFQTITVMAAECLLLIASIVPLFYSPWSVNWVAHQGYKYQIKGENQKALEWYQKSLQMDGEQGWVWGNMALIYQDMGEVNKYQEAVKNLKKYDKERAAEFETRGLSNSDK